MWMREAKPAFDEEDRCLCVACTGTQPKINNNNNTTDNNNTDHLRKKTADSLPDQTVLLTANGDNTTHNKPAAKLPSAESEAQHEHRASFQRPQHENRVGWMALGQQSQATNCYPGMAVPPVHAPQMFSPIANFPTPMTPWLHPAAAPFAASLQTPQFCCHSYMQWHNSDSRRGRPPHDYHCRRIRKLKMDRRVKLD